ncbi:hypothetical protein SAMN04487897_11737 [Paenibacillus sp. yr247]|nr:hypothetical protein SAMN04487897_11737 [Paenibacillus sp. yr247]
MILVLLEVKEILKKFRKDNEETIVVKDTPDVYAEDVILRLITYSSQLDVITKLKRFNRDFQVTLFFILYSLLPKRKRTKFQIH